MTIQNITQKGKNLKEKTYATIVELYNNGTITKEELKVYVKNNNKYFEENYKLIK